MEPRSHPARSRRAEFPRIFHFGQWHRGDPQRVNSRVIPITFQALFGLNPVDSVDSTIIHSPSTVQSTVTEAGVRPRYPKPRPSFEDRKTLGIASSAKDLAGGRGGGSLAGETEWEGFQQIISCVSTQYMAIRHICSVNRLFYVKLNYCVLELFINVPIDAF